MSTTTTTAQTSVSTWNLDPSHAVAEFKVKHLMISNVKGQFAALKAVLKLDESDITRSKVEASIETASIDTREPQRDAHLKSPDFFDVEKFPALTFHSTGIERSGDDLIVDGNLTIRDTTRPVKL